MNSQVTKFAERAHELHKELERPLLALAFRYGAPRPQAVVQEWLSRAYEIVDRFDKRELNPQVKVDGKWVNYIHGYHDESLFVAELKRYLKRAFINDMHKVYHRSKKTISDQDAAAASAVASFSGVSGYREIVRPIFKYDALRLDTLIKLFESDLDKTEASANCVLDVIQSNFVKALIGYCKELQHRPGWEDFVVIPDPDEKDNKKYFSQDFRSDLEDGLRKQLCKRVLAEDSPMVIEKLSKLISPSNKAALQKRIFRYLFEYKGGVPARVRNRIKNKSL